jgi:hypothetical protein
MLFLIWYKNISFTFMKISLISFENKLIKFNQTTKLSLGNLIKLGPCLASAISVNYIQNISSSDFVSYFSAYTGSALQPNETETQAIQNIIT